MEDALERVVACLSLSTRTANLVETHDVEEIYASPSDPLPTALPAVEVLEANLIEVTTLTEDNTVWILDSGANVHMTGEGRHLSHFVPLATSSKVATAGGFALDIKGKGALTFNDNKISDILYVPSARRNLISIGKITDLGHTVCFNSTHCP